MPITDTVDRLKVKDQRSKVRRRTNLCFYIALLPFVFYLLVLSSGCAKNNEIDLAQEAAGKSQIYYQHAQERYKLLISSGKDTDRLHFELGRLYYQHGDFAQAIPELKQSGLLQAHKLLAISYYRSADFTDALTTFNKKEISDDEYLYYYGLSCEKLNLFDQALKVYQKIKGKPFKKMAQERRNLIEKEEDAGSISKTDRKIYDILKSAPPPEEFPQAGALILYCDEKIEITDSGTQVAYLHYLIKILNQRGKEKFSETSVSYDSTYEKVELEYARLIRPDGTIVDVGSRHLRDVSRYLNFPLYSNARAFIISFPEVSDGAVIEYKLKISRSQLINKKDFVLDYSLQSSEPILSADFTLTAPKNTPLRLKCINQDYDDFGAKLEARQQEKGDKIIYHWQFKNIPQIIPEPNMPPDAELNPTILISTFNNWNEVYQWWWKLAAPKIKADAAIKAKVKELTRGKDSAEDRARAIYNFCAKEIRYVAVEYGDAGYEPHEAADIFKNKYGDCKDQAVLLVTMLTTAGFDASFPVLIATKEAYNLNQDFPSLSFNHCIAALRLKDKIIFLDPTASSCSFGDLPFADQARRVLVFTPGGYQIEDTPFYTAEHNLIRHHLEIKVNNDESIEAGKEIYSFGVYDQAQRYWLLYTQPELIAQAIKERIQEVSIGAKLTGYHIENLNDLNRQVVLSYEFSGPEYFTCAGPLRILPQLGGVDNTLVAQERRRFALDLNVPDTKEMNLEIAIPQGFVIKYMPENINTENPWFNFSAEYGFKENKLFFSQKMLLKKSLIAQSEYPEFKRYFEELARKIKQRIVLEKIK